MDGDNELRQGEQLRSEELTLPLWKVTSSRAFGREESFWEEPVKRLMKLLRGHEKRLHRGGDGGQLPCLAFSVLGGRGSGKSSLLRTFEERLKEEKKKEEEEGKLSVYILRSVDPTLLSRYDNFLHAFVAALLEDLEKRAEDARTPLHELKCSTALQRMAEHLWVVNGGPPKEKDRVAAGLERLDRHRSGPILKDRLKDFLDQVAWDFASLSSSEESHNEKAILLLPVDDPDMAFGQFTDILEIYRRYLRHPNLVPIFAFSRDLAHELLTVRFAAELGVAKSRRSGRGEERREADRLAHHFLDKLLPVGSRVTLELPQARLLSASIQRSPKAEKSETVEDLLKRCSKVLFGEAQEESRLHARILPATLRRQLHLLGELGRILPARKEGDQPAEEGREGEYFLDLAEAILGVHLHRLEELGVEVEIFQGQAELSRRGFLLEHVFRSGLRHGIQVWSHQETESLLLSLLALRTFRPLSGRRREGGGKEKEQPASFDLGAENLISWSINLLSSFYLPLEALGTHVRKRSEGTRKVNEERASRECRDDSAEDKEGGPEVRGRSAEAAFWTWDRRTVAASLIRQLGYGGAETLPGILFLHPGGRLERAQGNLEGPGFRPGDYVGSTYHKSWRNAGYAIRPWLEACQLLPEQNPGRLNPLGGLPTLFEVGGARTEIFLRLWCVFGNRPRPWAALSLWRGLGLMGRVLSLHVPASPSEQGESAEKDNASLRASLLQIIEEHLLASEMQGGIPWLRDEGEWKWRIGGPSAGVVGGREAISEEVRDLAGKLAAGLGEWLVVSGARRQDQRIRLRSFIRRLHGAALVGELLNTTWAALHHEPLPRRGAGSVLRGWLESLFSYWSESEKPGEIEGPVVDLLRSCPLLPDFVRMRSKLAAKDKDEAKTPGGDEAKRSGDLKTGRGRGEEALSSWELLFYSKDFGSCGLKSDQEFLDALYPADSEAFFRPLLDELGEMAELSDR